MKETNVHKNTIDGAMELQNLCSLITYSLQWTSNIMFICIYLYVYTGWPKSVDPWRNKLYNLFNYLKLQQMLKLVAFNFQAVLNALNTRSLNPS